MLYGPRNSGVRIIAVVFHIVIVSILATTRFVYFATYTVYESRVGHTFYKSYTCDRAK